jgi:sugar lactone lactonase YvrE
MRDRKILRREVDGSLVEHADLSGLAPWHLNDMLVNHDGRAWVGNFGFDLTRGARALLPGRSESTWSTIATTPRRNAGSPV